MNELEFLWLSHFVGVDFRKYIELIKVFKDVEGIYSLSNNKNEFIKTLKKNKIYLEKEVLKKIISFDEKYNAKIKLLELKANGVYIITLNNTKYSRFLNNEYIMFCYGNVKLLDNIKLSIYDSNNIKEKSYNLLNDLVYYLSKNNITIVSDNTNTFTNIYCSEILTYYKRESFLNVSFKLDKGKNNIVLKDEFKLMSNISCGILFVPINYDIKAGTLTDMFLEQGKDILAIPSDIYNKDTYFSNFLIKCGATVITSKKDLLYEVNYLSNLNINTRVLS